MGLVALTLILSQLLRKTLFFLYYTLTGLFSRGCLTLKLVDSAKLHNTDLHEKMQNVPVLSGFFKEKMAIKEQVHQEGPVAFQKTAVLNIIFLFLPLG